MTSPNRRRSFIDHVHGWNRICNARCPSPVRLRAPGDIDFTHHAPADRGGLEAQASREADASETSSGEGARATLLLSRPRNGLAGLVHRFERDLGDHAAVLDHVLEALTDKTALGHCETVAELVPPVAGETAGAMISRGGERPSGFWWARPRYETWPTGCCGLESGDAKA